MMEDLKSYKYGDFYGEKGVQMANTVRHLETRGENL